MGDHDDEIKKIKSLLEKHNISDLTRRINLLEVQMTRLGDENVLLKECLGYLTTGFQEVMLSKVESNNRSQKPQKKIVVPSDDAGPGLELLPAPTTSGVTVVNGESIDEVPQNELNRSQSVNNDQYDESPELFAYAATCSNCREKLPANSGLMIPQCLHIFCNTCLQKIWDGLTFVCPFINKAFKCYSRCRFAEGTITELLTNVKKWQCKHCSFINESRSSGVCYMCCRTKGEEMNIAGAICIDDGRKSHVVQCSLCTDTCERVAGCSVVIFECGHPFCANCILRSLKNLSVCPQADCFAQLSATEMTTVTKFDGQALSSFNDRDSKLFRCRSVDCFGRWLPVNMTTSVLCPNCLSLNCIPCQDVHADYTCKDYQDGLFQRGDKKAEQLRRNIQAMLKNSLAIQCPHCRVGFFFKFKYFFSLFCLLILSFCC